MPKELSRSLQHRHVTMISIGGIIGAGLFVSSSAAIAAVGPAIVLSYLITGVLVLLVMRMLGEMALALPGVFAAQQDPGAVQGRVEVRLLRALRETLAVLKAATGRSMEGDNV